MTFFEIRHGNVWRGETLALRDFSLTLSEGESVAVLGPNGAGKSTLLGLLTGAFRAEARPETSCRLFGEELWSLWELRTRLGMIMPEDVRRFDDGEAALDAVRSSFRGAFGRTHDMRFSKRETGSALAAMERMNVAHLASREFGHLSSGEQRRILIARALVHDPRVIVLDEPSTALDFAASIQLGAVLRELPASGHTLVWVTHHPGEIPPEVERAILLKDGRVFADGPKREVLRAPILGDLYDVDLTVRWSRGWCEVRPG
jgi:iron complex transport system ATP-binding protein